MKPYDPSKVENEILKFWKKNKIYEKQKKTYAKNTKRWSFLDGPMTANNPMGVHHAWGRTLKDLYLRFKAAQRFNIRRQNGYDSQGLWIEVEVEKAKGLKSTQDIEKYGVGRFIEACKARTAKMAKKITQQSIRLGQWMDWDDTYYTHSDSANDTKWWFIKECHKNGRLYKGVDVVPWCPRCSAVQSKHALATEGYWDEEDYAIFMKFPIAGKEKEYLLVWTTTPWTMAADVAVAAHPDIYYVRAQKGDEVYIIAEKLAEKVLGKHKVLNRFLGMDLEGQKYVMPYADLPAQKEAVMSGAKPDDPLIPAPHIVVMWDEVSEEDGTGMVHIAPGCGPEDYLLGKQERLPAISPLDKEGKYMEGYGWLTGNLASEMNKKVIDDMKKRGFIFKVEKYAHRYPHCTRCKTPVIFRLVPEWYLSMDDLRQPCLAANKTINWVPKQGSKYEEAWLNNMGDWLFSRKRYYGLAMPIWECEDCDEYVVIGGEKELKKKAVKGTFKYYKEHRRPGVDKVLIACPKCGKPIRRVPDTVDVWMDAGMMPFYTLKYFKDKKYFNKWFPADFVTECGPGQYRLWFFMMLMHSVAITKKAPFKNILTNELVKNEKGEEMHKSSGTAIWFDEAAEKVGSDTMRWLYSKQDTTKELWFGWGPLKEEYRSLNVLWNLAKYASTNFDLTKTPKKPTKLSQISKWVLSKLETLKAEVTENLELFKPNLAARAIENFYLNILSRSYGQMIRDNLNAEVNYVLHKAIRDILILMAPFVPFVTEKIYQEVFRGQKTKESIHLFEWPKANKKLINKSLESELDLVQEIISAALASRTKMQRGTRWPVKTLTITTKKKAVRDAIKQYAELIKSMTNVVEIKTAASIKGAKLEIKPNFKVLGKKIGGKVKQVARALAKAKTVPKTVKVGKETIKLTEEDLDVREILPKGLTGVRSKDFAVYLDDKETQEMLASGYARELTRKVQDLRKAAGLTKKDKIDLTISTPPIDLKKYAAEIKAKVGAKKLTFGAVKGKHKATLVVRKTNFKIGLILA